MRSQATRGATVRDDRGIILVVVMMAIVLLSVIGVAAFTISAQSITDSTRVRSQATALQAASSGLERVISIPGTPTVGPAVVGDLGGGHYSVTVTQDSSGAFVNRYLYTSVGTTGSATCTVRQYVDHTWTDPWSIEISGKQATMGSGSQLNAKSELRGPFYIVGDVDLNSNPYVGDGPWYVTGTKATFRNKWIPGLDPTTQTLYTNAECVVTGWPGPVVRKVPPLELPYVDQEYINGTYALAGAESSDNLFGCSGSASNPLEVNTLGIPNTYSATRFPGGSAAPNLSPCYKIVQETNAIGAPTRWNGTSTRREYVINGDGSHAFGRTSDDFALVGNVLYVRGTVFVDGNLTIKNNVTGYMGFGTIVVNGNVTLGDAKFAPELQPADAADKTTQHNLTQTTNLGIVAVGNITTYRIPFEGTLFSNATITLGDKADAWGSIHGLTIIGNNETDIMIESTVAFESVPPSMPGSTTDPRPPLRRYRKVLGPWTRQ